MKIVNQVVITIAIVGITTCCTHQDRDMTIAKQAREYKLADEATEQKIDSIYQKMSLEEKVAQLQCLYWQDLFDENKQLDTAMCRKLIPNGIGHIPQYATNSIESPEEMRRMLVELQNWLINNTPSGIPALFHEEVLTGFCAKGSTIYPQQIGQACSFNADLAVLKAKQTAEAMRQTGGMLALSPMVDVIKNPYFNRLEESYGEDAYLSAVLGCAFVEGLQWGGYRNGVMTTSKHFLGYGGGGEAPEKELYEEILLPHETMIRTQGSKSVMMGYHTYNDTLCTINHYLMQHVLRDYLNFDGIIVTDYGAMDNPACGKDKAEKATNAINAGMEVEFPSIGNYALLPELLEKGTVSEDTFEKAVKHVLKIKAALGLLDEAPQLYSRENIVYDSDAERQTAYEIATQSVVLLKNDGILPINKPKKIALVGPNANTMWAMTGDYTYPAMKLFWQNTDVGNVNDMIVTLKEGLESHLPEGGSIDYTMGCDWTDDTKVDLSQGGDSRAWQLMGNRRIIRDEEISEQKALDKAAESDLIVAAMGENVYLCGENRDRGSLKLPGKQEEFVRKLIDTGKPVVLVMFGGRALVIGDLADKCAAVLHAWYPGEEGGNAVADILYGNVNPSAKLSVGYPKIEINAPICYNTSKDQDERIQYPFGFGLSYTNYDYSSLKSKASADTSDNCFEISFDVTNTGEMTGDEIVQVYLSPTTEEQNIRPIKLIGFTRVPLQPGEKRTVKCLISPEQLGYYDNGVWNIESGKYEISVGGSSQYLPLKTTIQLKGKKITLPLRNNYFSIFTI